MTSTAGSTGVETEGLRPEAHISDKVIDTNGDSTTTSNEKDGPQYPRGIRLALIILGVALASLCTSLDRTIVATAIPNITSEFNSLGDVGWYGSAYLFTNCAFQLLFGKLFTRVSVKWTFVAALVIFEIGSAICGAAPNSTALIVGRAIAGIGCAGISSGSFVIAALVLPVESRPKYTGLLSGIMGLAITTAPTIGGALSEHVTWRWCFYINLPLGAVSLPVIIFLVNIPSKTQSSTFLEHLRNLDLPGTSIFIPSITSLLLALQWAGSEYPWSNWRIILLICVFGVSFIAWCAMQVWQGDKSTVPPRIVKQRSIYVGIFYMTVIGAATFVIAYYVPVWFQSVKNQTPQESGVDYLAVSICGSLFALVAGVLTSRIGYYVPSMYIGLVTFSVGGGLLLRFDLDTSLGYWLGTMILLGTGVGFAFQVGVFASQTVLEDADIAIGTSLMIVGQTLGGAVFICAAQNVFINHLLTELAARAPELDPAAVVALGAARLQDRLEALLQGNTPEVVAVLESYNVALKQVWIMVLVLVCLSLFGALGMEWRSVKKSQVDGNESVEKSV